ncbi:MAG TPA: ABC transporter ATP-binding protein [Thermodesulfobacteriota bacterium]|nr:ABC transporter ATP-binding protein [Thermodesulfobacteriota bacterium]
MGDIAIRVEGLSKQYHIGAKQERYKTLRDTLADAFVSPFRRARKLLSGQATGASELHEIIWALKDVSFEVKRGEVVGIIGRNGAGKSTLLKVLSRITEPTAGYADIYGRVGSLLEVGTGFHQELTGRENIYLNGAILGMKRMEIDRKFDEIIDFAEVEKFIDTPVKHYSSGMYLRLAFAVAAHLEPEILVVDEVLAVGDVAFQKKCLGKMGDVAKEGRTILFVSHNMAAIRQLCQTGMLLDSGLMVFSGPVIECVNKYLVNRSDQLGSILAHISNINPAVKIDSITINGSPFDQLELPTNSRLLKIEIIGRISQPMRLEVEARIYDLYEIPLAFFSPGHEKGYADLYPAGPFSLVRYVELPRMMRGEYYLDLLITNPDVIEWVYIPRAVQLFAEGTPLSTGRVFDYSQGRGWILLASISDGTR